MRTSQTILKLSVSTDISSRLYSYDSHSRTKMNRAERTSPPAVCSMASFIIFFFLQISLQFLHSLILKLVLLASAGASTADLRLVGKVA